MEDKLNSILIAHGMYGIENLNEAVSEILLLFDVSNSVCSCRPNTDLYCKTIIYCNKCNKEVKVVRTN